MARLRGIVDMGLSKRSRRLVSCVFGSLPLGAIGSPSCEAQERRIDGRLQATTTRQGGRLRASEEKTCNAPLHRCSPGQEVEPLPADCALH